MKKCLVLMMFLWMFLPSTTRASDPLALEAMETLRRGFAGSSDFTAEIRQEKKLALMKRTLVSRGQVRFRKPGLFFMEIYPPHASRLLLRDNVMSMRLVEQGVTERIVLPPEESLTRWFDYLAKPVRTLPDAVDVKASRRGELWTMEIQPKGKGAVQRLTLKFDRDGTISRLVIEERNGDSTTLVFSQLRRNVGLQDGDFKVE